MDLTAAFKSEVFRPIAIYVIPGFVAAAPYLAVAAANAPEIAVLWADYTSVAAVIAVLSIIAVGMVIEMLGAQIETHVWDPLCEAVTACQTSDWYAYLSRDKDDEVVADRYLRTTLLKFKFESGLGIALVVSWPGIMWFDAITPFMTDSARFLLTIGMLGLASYLIWESGISARLLGNIRHIILTKEPLPTLPRAKRSGFHSRLIWMASGLLFAQAVAGWWLIRSEGSGAGNFPGPLLGVIATVFAVVAVFIAVVPPRLPARSIARRLCGAFLLGCALVVIRMADTGLSGAGFISLSLFAVLATLFGVAAGRDAAR